MREPRKLERILQIAKRIRYSDESERTQKNTRESGQEPEDWR